MADSSICRVLVAHPSPVARLGLVSLVAADPGLRVVSEASGLEEVCRACRDDPPHVVVAARQLADGTVLELAARLRELDPVPGLVALVPQACVHELAELWSAGVSAIVSEGVEARGLDAAVRTAASGGHSLDRTFSSVFHELLAALPPRPQTLDEEECRFLRLLACGFSNRDIAQALHVEPRAVRRHVSRLIHNLGFRSRFEAVVWWARYFLKHPTG